MKAVRSSLPSLKPIDEFLETYGQHWIIITRFKNGVVLKHPFIGSEEMAAEEVLSIGYTADADLYEIESTDYIRA